VPQQKPKLITQIQERGEPQFQDESSETIREDSSEGNALLLAFKKLVLEKRPETKRARIVGTGESMAMEASQECSGPVDMVNNEFPTPEKQQSSKLHKQRNKRTSPTRNRPTKRQASASKGKKLKRKMQETPVISKLASGPQISRSPLQGETSGEQEANTTTATAKPRKHKKRPGLQDRPPKLKKQPSLQGEPPELRNKLEASNEPPRLKMELLLPDDTPPGEKSQAHEEEQPQEEKQQPPSIEVKSTKITIPIITWHPPFSASVVSDLTCPDCGRAFRQRADVRRHRYVHTKEKPYACTLCDKRFGHPSNLHIHQRTHSGERPYKCPECGKAFTQSCNLRTHRKIHSGSKPFHCCICSKSFLHRSILTIHQRVHTGERPYACSVCPKRFSDRSTLVQHERTHTGERPYACQVCERRFSQLSHLVKHTRVHSGARGLPPTPPKSSLGQQEIMQPNSKDSCRNTDFLS
ncbi:UNVERIFIED_CONTAM: hypothetical protein K2H54_062865, partial [Gekko kuhli]